ncbi:MAG: metallophosphoesterase, partial [Natronomonas sp.]
MFDRSLLPPADWEFVLLADTHFMLETDSVEFESRRQQTARIDPVLEQINALDPAFIVHLGDLVQEFPGSGAFGRAMDEAQRQLEQLDSE